MFRIKLLALTLAAAAVLVIGNVVPAASTKAPRAVLTTSQAQSVSHPQAVLQARPAATARAAAVNCRRVKCIALTYDDGPVPDTRRLLAVLERKGASATFFVLGSQVRRFPAEARAAVRGGHEIGVHSWSHSQLTKLSASAVRADLMRTAREIRTVTGARPRLVRPPYGATNATVRTEITRLGMKETLWEVDTEDWKNRSVQVTTARALAGARPGRIILMHDIRPTSVDATARIIDALKKQGYRFVTVSQLQR